VEVLGSGSLFSRPALISATFASFSFFHRPATQRANLGVPGLSFSARHTFPEVVVRTVRIDTPNMSDHGRISPAADFSMRSMRECETPTSARFEADCGSTDDANTFAALLQASLRKYQVGDSNPDLAALLDSAQVVPAGDRLDVTLTTQRRSNAVVHQAQHICRRDVRWVP